ncbi:hypothetical protein H5410_058068 [Solanum commersonii]|uniref:Uncharacterized protein n=1 Tax=Solanum commersonii TaxID=4109 RepID=A0A9J5WSK5_SOLCO|nr:hypothetical protein H5410_058068 [Solanum commersonii]
MSENIVLAVQIWTSTRNPQLSQISYPKNIAIGTKLQPPPRNVMECQKSKVQLYVVTKFEKLVELVFHYISWSSICSSRLSRLKCPFSGSRFRSCILGCYVIRDVDDNLHDVYLYNLCKCIVCLFVQSGFFCAELIQAKLSNCCLAFFFIFITAYREMCTGCGAKSEDIYQQE